MEYSGLTKVLGGEKVLRKNIQNQMDLIELSNLGITKDALEHLINFISIPLGQIANLLPITKRTIERYPRKKHFNRVVSEQIIQIAEITAKGVEIFGDKDGFLVWFNHPNKAFSGKTPISLMVSRFGAEMVLDELGRMEYGVIS